MRIKSRTSQFRTQKNVRNKSSFIFQQAQQLLTKFDTLTTVQGMSAIFKGSQNYDYLNFPSCFVNCFNQEDVYNSESEIVSIVFIATVFLNSWIYHFFLADRLRPVSNVVLLPWRNKLIELYSTLAPQQLDLVSNAALLPCRAQFINYEHIRIH